MAYQYQENLDSQALSRYVFKLNLIGMEGCPYKVPADKWIDDLKKWPSIQYQDVFHYLIKSPRIYSSEAMENYKSLEAHTFFVSGWVQRVLHLKLENGNFIMKADVKPSWRVTDDPHHPWVALKKTGQVITAHCDCMAGLGETCSHVGALLFKMEAAVRLGYTTSACTDVPCAWNDCFVKNVQPAPIADIKFYKKESKLKIQNSKKGAARSFDPSTEAEQDLFLDSLATLDENVVGLSAFSKYSERFIGLGPSATAKKVPRSFRFLYAENNVNLNELELKQLCDDTFNELSATRDEIVYLEEITRNQSSSSTWHEQRLGRLTSSVAADVLRTNQENPAASLLKKICQPLNTQLKVPSVMWGNEHEHDAYLIYSNVHAQSGQTPSCVPSGNIYMTNQGKHEDCTVSKSGFVVSEHKPYIGASPDGLVNCTCCGKGVLEIKCPFKHKDRRMQDIVQDKDFCIGPDFKLKESDKYYTQVQLQMYVCDASYADFLVWTPVDCIITRVSRNDSYIHHMLEVFDKFWRTWILPELLTRKNENFVAAKGDPQIQSTSANTPKYCLCKTGKNLDNMVGCDKCDNWFHPKCLGLKRLPRSKTWYCPDCRKNTNKYGQN